jgi:hypothetical protein
LILDGSELSDVRTIIAELVESQGNGALIWLPDADGKHLHCAVAASLPGFAANVLRTCVCPKGASCGTAVYRKEPLYVADILRESIGDDWLQLSGLAFRHLSNCNSIKDREMIGFHYGRECESTVISGPEKRAIMKPEILNRPRA